MEIAAFLVSSASDMNSDESLSLTDAMARAGTQLKWSNPVRDSQAALTQADQIDGAPISSIATLRSKR